MFFLIIHISALCLVSKDDGAFLCFIFVSWGEWINKVLLSIETESLQQNSKENESFLLIGACFKTSFWVFVKEVEGVECLSFYSEVNKLSIRQSNEFP